jgi:hypothetical protein
LFLFEICFAVRFFAVQERDEMSVGRLGNAEHKKSRLVRESADFYQFNMQAERGSTGMGEVFLD